MDRADRAEPRLTPEAAQGDDVPHLRDAHRSRPADEPATTLRVAHRSRRDDEPFIPPGRSQELPPIWLQYREELLAKLRRCESSGSVIAPRRRSE
jgi:hypothetical protein